MQGMREEGAEMDSQTTGWMLLLTDLEDKERAQCVVGWGLGHTWVLL